MIGQVLGNRYEILEKIGEGGMAVVYKARCNKLNRFVAVKILKSDLASNEETVGKFIREATAIATLSDPNIVNVLDVGNQDDLYYIVMEYVKGDTLKKVIKEYGTLNYEAAVDVAIQIAKALDCAHRNNIIHRDVKPQNILLTEEGRVKVADFGIAKSTTTQTITNTTTIMGSAHYFSPEQAKGSVVDARTDLYSLGVVIYEMVTGKVPFEADSPVSIALKHIQEDVVSPKQINSKIPESLSNLIVKAMDKEPAKRYQNAKEIIADLQRIKADPNAQVQGKEESQDDRTIIMAPVKAEAPAKASTQPINDIQDEEYYDEYDEDDYYDDDDDDYNNRKRKKKGSGKKIIIGILIAILVIFGLGTAGYLIASSTGESGQDKSEVTIPTLKGMTKEEAEEKLKELGLELVDRGSESSDEPEGTIIGVDPKEGTKVKKGSKVNIITSDGGEKLEMKDFKESELDTVKTFLTKNGIKFTQTNEYSDDVEEGLVIKTDPGAGTEISKDTVVTITVSSGRKVKKATVPNVIGMSLSAAKSKLSSFDVDVQETETTDESKVGVVIDQTNSGKQLEEGSTVTIYIGKAAEQKEVNINDYINTSMTGAQAKKALEAKGFTVLISGNSSDNVTGWDPTSAKKGATITIITKPKQSTTNNNTNNNTNNSTDGNTNDSGDKKSNGNQ